MKGINEYFEIIEKDVKFSYDKANEVRALHYDPEDKVEIFLAKDMAERVVGLLSTIAPQIVNTNLVERVNEIEKKYGKLDFRVALQIGLEVAQEKFCKFKDKKEAMEVGIRFGLAYLTLGVVSSPLEGFTRLEIKKRKDGKEYFALFFSGPIRSAGTTVTCGSILVADYIRKQMGYSEYDPSEEEIKRIVTEVIDFHEKITNLQYLPSQEEIDFMVRNLPLQIDGDPSEDMEVSNYRFLDRIETNRLRNGVCLVIAEALTQKAFKFWGKILSWYKNFDLGHWSFLGEFVKLQKKIKSRSKLKEQDDIKLVPDYTYIKDLVAGRPILSHPLRTGGFRVRYGRSRTSGLSSLSIHPATMYVLDNFLGIGTQIRYERPGKSTAVAPCDTIEGPIVKLRDGSVKYFENIDEAKNLSNKIEEILFLGDILINYGEFFNRGHFLVPVGYNEEWWAQEIKNKKIELKELSKIINIDKKLLEELLRSPSNFKLSFDEAIVFSNKLGIPLHPKYTYHWNDISKEEFMSLVEWMNGAAIDKNGEFKIILNLVKEPKRTLEILGVPHIVSSKEFVIIENDWAKAIAFTLGFLESNKIDIEKIKNIDENNVLEILTKISGIKIKDKSGTFIGARMGRPEKSKMRKLTGSPQVLFPVGVEGGKLRSFQSAIDFGKVRADFPLYYCLKCDKETIYPVCQSCDKRTEKRFYCPRCNRTINERKCKLHNEGRSFIEKEIDINDYFNAAISKLKLKEKPPELIKGVKGTSSKEHTPENLAKGILRSIYNLYVNKDGTIRYDMTEMPITHFRPKEIRTDLKKLKEMGYDKDMYGNNLVNEDQLVEIFPQDIILPSCPESNEEGADLVFYRVANFIDDLLMNFYGKEKFYNLKDKEDLVGHLVIGLAPHISAGMIGRIIGFSKTQVCYANPLWHASLRRDCEGDECCIILLMDALINFSKSYLPAHRGSTQDSCLVLTSKIIASEVDDMVFDMDVVWEYPLEIYEEASNLKEPWSLKIEQIKDRIDTEKQYYDFGFTHDVSDINMGVVCSAYKSLPTMQEKVIGQMNLAIKIRAVDADDVARLVIDRHFIRDIKGNLRKFSTQEFRCSKCNEKYRRPPLAGKCLKCDGRIIFTVSEGSVIKYLEPTLELARLYKLPLYLEQTLNLTKRRIDSVFGVDEEKQEGLTKWFS